MMPMDAEQYTECLQSPHLGRVPDLSQASTYERQWFCHACNVSGRGKQDLKCWCCGGGMSNQAPRYWPNNQCGDTVTFQEGD